MTDDPLACWRAGRISGEVAVARLLLAGADLAVALAGAPELQALAAQRAATIAPMAAMLAAVRHDRTSQPAAIAAAFDRAVAIAPEASVAAYSLGDPETLGRATAEVVAWLAARSFIEPGHDVLDLGCGIGRVAAALAPLCRSVLGIDISAGMIATARDRYACETLGFILGDGTDLPAEAFDLVLAVDSMPYMLQSGIADAVVAASAHALVHGGALVMLNLSYQGLDADRQTARRWAQRHDLTLLCDGEAPFALWDATAFALRRVA